ncbi:hypothetical protein GF342_05595 [Candidatus Woesearchaeota archaeon]|nr:hypothetical protein [Candidatus Woesearchaeota archaeon]
MKAETRLTLYLIGIGVVFFGGLLALFVYPFAQTPRSPLPDDVVLEYGYRVLGTPQVFVTHVQDDGEIFFVTQNTSLGTLNAAQLEELTAAISERRYDLDRRNYYSIFSQVTCKGCVDSWLVVKREDQSVQVIHLDAPEALKVLGYQNI